MKIRSEILAIIASGEFDGPNFRITAGTLDRKVYQEVAKVIDAAGGKWNKKSKALVFDGDAAAALEPVILTGEIVHRKQEFGQFDTPEPLAAEVVDYAELRPGMMILEPSCGIGNLVLAIEDECGAIVTGFEIDDVRRTKAQSRCVFAGGLHGVDFLSAEATPIYDVALMNPPFAGQDDIRHVVRAADFVKPDGRVVAIMSSSVTFRQNQRTVWFREFVRSHRGEINPLPEDSFKTSGTSVNTCLVSFYV